MTDPTSGCPSCGTVSRAHDALCGRSERVFYLQDGVDISEWTHASQDADEIRLFSANGALILQLVERLLGEWQVVRTVAPEQRGLMLRDRDQALIYAGIMVTAWQ